MKGNYNRYNVSSDLLKRVIIRFDYQGMTSVDSWILQLKSQNFGNFQKYNRNYMSPSQGVDRGDGYLFHRKTKSVIINS